MKKTLSIILAVLTVLSVLSMTAFAVDTPAIADLVCDFDGIDITWDAVEGATSYVIYRSEEGADAVCIGTTNKCTFTDVNVEEGVTYEYSIAATDGEVVETSAVQSIAYIRPNCSHKGAKFVVDYPATVYENGKKHKHCNTCGADFEVTVIKQLVPAAATLTAANKATGIKLTWNVVDGADAYRVYRRVEGTEKYTRIATVTKGTSYTDKTAKSGVKYKYVVRSVNEAGLCEYKSICAKTIVRAGTPTELQVANKQTGIQFKWNKIAGATGYRVYRKAVGDESFTYLGTVKTTYYNDKKTEAGVDYIYTVKAVVNGTKSANLSGIAIRRIENPKLLKTKTAKEGIYVEFEQVEGATGYYVYRKIGNGSWKKLGTINNTKSRIYLDNSAEKGVTYTYTVRGYCKANGVTSISAYNKAGISCKDKY